MIPPKLIAEIKEDIERQFRSLPIPFVSDKLAVLFAQKIAEARELNREMRMKAMAWDINRSGRSYGLKDTAHGFSCVFALIIDNLETVIYPETNQYYPTAVEAICRAAVAAKIKLNGKVLTEEDLQ